MFFDDTLQNTKRYRWCDDGFGHGKKLFMEIVEGAIVEGLSGGVQCL